MVPSETTAPRATSSARLIARVAVLAESPEMRAIGRALPLSFIGLGVGLAVFMALQHGGTLLSRFSHSFGAAFGAMSTVLVILLAYDLAARRSVPPLLAAVVAGSAFFLSLPYSQATSIASLAQAVGSSGLFLAIGLALLSVTALRFGRRYLGARAGYSLAAASLVAGAAALAAYGVSLTGLLNAAIAPLGDLGDSLSALLIITLIETVLWSFGIHGPALLAAVVVPVYMNLQLQNTEALAHNQPLPHIVTVSTFLFVFPGGAGATFPLVLLLARSAARRVRNVAFAALLPSLANANEPLMFGLPLVLNPVLGVPFVVTPLVLGVVSWFAISLGWVARPAYYVPSSIPLPFGAFLATKDWRAAVLVLVNVALGAAIYAPFVAIYERHERERSARGAT